VPFSHGQLRAISIASSGARCRGRKPRAGIVDGSGHNRDAMLKMTTAGGGGETDVGPGCGRVVSREPGLIARNLFAKRGLRMTADRQDLQRTIHARGGRGDRARRRRRFFDDDVRVDAAQAERADAGDAAAVRGLPRFARGDHFDRCGIPRDMRVGPIEVEVRRQGLVP
jgi:hypothetical protein